MEVISWKEELSVGVKEIDEQHKQLIKLLNELFSAMSKGQGKPLLKEIIGKLTDYTKVHFRAEERLMTVYGYPGLEQQKIEHSKFIKTIVDFSKKFSMDKLSAGEVADFMKDWVINHILKTDKLYAPFFKKAGIQ
jgi:hemerythrin-like metal-binding protein